MKIRGGKRPNSGRRKKPETKLIRVPVRFEQRIKDFINDLENEEIHPLDVTRLLQIEQKRSKIGSRKSKTIRHFKNVGGKKVVLTDDVNFYVGLHQPNDANLFFRCMISYSRLISRSSYFLAHELILDSGAFTEIYRFGDFRTSTIEYAKAVDFWSGNPGFQIAVSQDYMCEPFILNITGLSVLEHHEQTIQRYKEIISLTDKPVMPVLQGYEPNDYVKHIGMYGELLTPGQWVGVGSVCKRNTDVGQVKHICKSILDIRPDLKLHGFGLKKTSLKDKEIRSMLYSADSMAWSYAALKEGRDPNSPLEARLFYEDVLKVV